LHKGYATEGNKIYGFWGSRPTHAPMGVKFGMQESTRSTPHQISPPRVQRVALWEE